MRIQFLSLVRFKFILIVAGRDVSEAQPEPLIHTDFKSVLTLLRDALAEHPEEPERNQSKMMLRGLKLSKRSFSFLLCV